MDGRCGPLGKELRDTVGRLHMLRIAGHPEGPIVTDLGVGFVLNRVLGIVRFITVQVIKA